MSTNAPETNEQSREILAKLKSLDIGDPEAAHSMADNLLLQYLEAIGHKEAAEAFRDADERAGGFWYA